MSKKTPAVKDILEKIDHSIVRANALTDRPRHYLGMSGLGDKCPRKIWLQWRWAKFETFSPRMLRLFNRGHLEEPRFVHYLRQAGYLTAEVDPKTNKQFEFSACEGHVMGHCDGNVNITGILHDWWLAEMKTHNAKSFAKVIRANNLEVSKHEHYCQCQRYMKAQGLRKTLYMAVNKDNDALHLEIVNYDERTVRMLLERERDLIARTNAPDGVSENPDYYLCSWCLFSDICHFDGKVNKTCRMCVHSHPTKNALWSCSKKGTVRTYQQQMKGCKKDFQVL